MPHTSSKEIETGAWLNGGGEIGALIRAFDGSQTSLGPLENWPQSLRLAVNLCLNAPMPLLLWWGANYIQFYNDAFHSLWGQPSLALGQTGPVAWGERWELLSPAVEATLRGEEAGETSKRRLLLEGAGGPVYLTFACSPVQDETGQIAGVWAAVTATPLPTLAGAPSGDGDGRSLKLNATLTRPEEAGAASPTPPDTYILNNMSDGFFILDRNWRFVYANNSGAALARQPGEVLLGKNVWDVFADLKDSDLQRQWQRAMAERTPVNFEYYYTTYQDWVAFRVYPSPEGIAVFATNITRQKQAEATLRESEGRFRLLADSAPVLIWLTNREGVEFVNRAYLEFVGVGEAEIKGDGWASYVHPDDMEDYVNNYMGAVARRDRFEAQLRFRRADGEYRWLKSVGVPRSSPAGEFLGYIGSSFDITDIKQGELTLTQAHQQLQAHLSNTPLGVVEWDAEFRISRWAGEAENIFGWPTEAVLGKYADDFDWIHEEDKVAVLAISTALARGEKVVSQNRNYDKEGRLHYCEWYNSALIGPEGRMQSVLSLILDVTDRHLAEQALRQSEARFRRLAEANLFGVAFGTFEGEITYANEAFLSMVGYTRQELEAGQIRWDQMTPPEYLPLDARAAEELKTRGAATPFEKEYIRKDGSRLPILIGGALLPSSPDGQQEVLTFYMDLTEQKQAEAALRASEERFSKAFHASPDALAITWREGILFEVNDSFEKILGYSREEALGQSIVALNSYVELAEHQQALALFKEQGFLRNYPLRLRTKSGEIRYFSLSTESIIINNELCRLNIMSDITEQRRAEEALRATEERFAKAFRASPDALAITSQVSGQILEVNEGWQKLFGYSHEEAIGQTPLGLALYAHAEDRPGVMSQLQSQGYLRNLELEVQNRWGKVHQVSLSAEPITVGEEPCLITIMRDITEQKQAERDLQASEREFRAMFELAGSGKIQVDPVTSRFLRVNQKYCELTGYTREELLNNVTAAEVTHPDDREREHEVVWPVRQGLHDHWQLEKRYLRKDGQVVWALVTGSLIRDETGRPLHTIATVQDISDRKEAEAALRRAHDELEQRVAERTAELQRSLQELNQFTYVASHDLKAPLRGVKQLANWISEDAGHLLPEASRTHLDKMHGRIQRMEKFLDDLLLYSRLERHYYQTKERVDTRALLQEIIEVLAPPPTFTISIQASLPVLMTYRMPLELTFKNLIENALKHHHRAEGRIEISARETGSFVEFSVTDDGPGIDPAFHQRIFQIFQTLHPRDERESTGAGLAIVQKAVEGQGGTITLISAPGQGATFRFTWPRKQSTGKL